MNWCCHCCKGTYKNTPVTDAYKCSDCGHIYRDYKGDADEYHASCYRKPNGEGTRDSEELSGGKITSLFHVNRKDICDRRVKVLQEIIDFSKENTCIDIGAGAGTFAMHLASSYSHLHIDCCEMDPLLVEASSQLGFNSEQSSIFEIDSDKKYDVVFMWHVLEHILDTRKVLSVLEKITNKYSVIEVPTLVALNGVGRRRELKEPNTENYDGHYHYFGEKSFRALIKDSQFEIIELMEGVQSPALLAILRKE